MNKYTFKTSKGTYTVQPHNSLKSAIAALKSHPHWVHAPDSALQVTSIKREVI